MKLFFKSNFIFSFFFLFSACARESTPEDYNPEELPHKGDYKGKFTIIDRMYNIAGCLPKNVKLN